MGKPSMDKNGRDGNKRTRTGNDFPTTANPVRRENMARDCRDGLKNVNPVNGKNPTVRACYEYGSTDHVRSACPRFNRAQGPRGNRPNQVVANNEGQDRGNQMNQARGRAFLLEAEEARQNIVTGIESSKLGFRYEIKIASRQLVEIDKVIKGCKLEIEDHVFDINLIPFGHESFDVIIGIDWLSNHKAEIICHEKVVRIPLLDGKVPRVLGERPKEKEIKFRIELTLGAVPVAKSLYQLAPSELEELSGQLKELQDKGEEQELAFQTLKDKLCNALVLALPDGPEDFVVYCDAFEVRLGCLLMQRGKVIAYASKILDQLKL
nr:hypothetical protein [Tanacetum cinerariifolium]